MNHRRSRLAWAMLVVLVVALDCALMRAAGLPDRGGPDDFRGQLAAVSVLPMANVLAVALVLAARRSGPARRFWAGFSTCSAATSALVLAGCILTERIALERRVASFGSWVAGSLFSRTDRLETTQILIFLAVLASAFALPQILTACLVGLIARYSRKVAATSTPPG